MIKTTAAKPKTYLIRKVVKSTWRSLPSSVRRTVPQAWKTRIRNFATGYETRLAQEIRKLEVIHQAKLQQEIKKLESVHQISLQKEIRKLDLLSEQLAEHKEALNDFKSQTHELAREILLGLERLPNAPDEMANVAPLVAKLHPTPLALRTALAMSERAAGLEKGEQIVSDLCRHLEDLNFPQSSASFTALRRSDSYLFSVINHVPVPAKPAYEHVGSKLLYILNNSLPYSSNGYATRSHGVIRGFQTTDLEVTAYTRAGYPKDMATTADPESVQSFDEIDGVTYHRIETPTTRSHLGKDYILEAAKSIQLVIEKEQPAYVMAASNYRNALPALIAARNRGLPFIYEVRSFWEITRASRDEDFKDSISFQVQATLEKKVAQEADLVLTLNSGMKAELIKRGVEEDKIHLLPNSVEPSLFGPLERDGVLAQELNIPDGVPVIGYIGTFVDYEGLDDLSRACALLKEQGVEFRLLLVGNDNPSSLALSGSVTDLIRACAQEGNFLDWLIMPGRVPFEVVRNYYSLIDIAPFPRKPWEVCELVSPLKPLESMIMAKSVIVSDVAALKDIVQHGETGFLYEKGNVQELAKALKQLICSPELRLRLGKNAQAWVSDFRTWEYSVSQVSAPLKALVEAAQIRESETF